MTARQKQNEASRRCAQKRYETDPIYRAEKIRKVRQRYFTKSGKPMLFNTPPVVADRYPNITAALKLIRAAKQKQ